MELISFVAAVLIMVFIASVMKGYKGTPDGRINPAMLCPHCQTRGSVYTKAIIQKKGVSGGKATAAVLTAGFSLLATGLSRKEHLTQAQCANCRNTWRF
jgi:hypothetical protein